MGPADLLSQIFQNRNRDDDIERLVRMRRQGQEALRSDRRRRGDTRGE